MTYLLDTNVWIAVLRKPASKLAMRFHAVTPADVRICSVVVAELRHGCLRSAKPAANRAAVDALLAPYTSPPSVGAWNCSASPSGRTTCKSLPSHWPAAAPWLPTIPPSSAACPA
jgi:hypothetical protein